MITTNENENKIRRTPDELRDAALEQLELLRISCESFDAGNHISALQIAVCIRVLLNETKRSRSVLRQLQEAFGIHRPLFYVIGYPNYGKRGFVRSNLTVYKLNVMPDNVMIDVAPCLDKPKLQCNFDRWWSEEVQLYWEEQRLTRKDIILLLADKDGGAHIDEVLPEKYMLLKRGMVRTPIFCINGIRVCANSQEYMYASARTIAEEVLITFQKFVIPKIT